MSEFIGPRFNGINMSFVWDDEYIAAIGSPKQDLVDNLFFARSCLFHQVQAGFEPYYGLSSKDHYQKIWQEGMQTLPEWIGFSDSRINLDAQLIKQFQFDWKSVEEDDWL